MQRHTVCSEKAELNSCSLYSDSGNIQASDLTASDFGLGCDYGDVTLKNIKGKEQLRLNLGSGNLNADTLSGKRPQFTMTAGIFL